MGEKLNEVTSKIMEERFAKDNVIALATVEDGMPYVRSVDGYYEDGSFYVVTYALSNKMRQIEKQPEIAISGEWFTAHGVGENLGYIRNPENSALAEKLRTAFAAWYNEGDVNEEDPNTCILRIRLTDGILFSHGSRYEIDFN